MTFNIEEAIAILERTPLLLNTYLIGLPLHWIHNHEGKDTWSAYDVVGHLIVGEETDWMVRAEIIMSDSESKAFTPFDRFLQMENDTSVPLEDLLHNFAELRSDNLSRLKKMALQASDFKKEGVHPEFGAVKLEQLLAAWVVHDLGHIAQISRVLAKYYSEAVGPWSAYLSILKPKTL